MIGIDLCSREALERVAPLWGVKVTKGGSRGACKPTPDNPERRVYRLQAEGARAKLIIDDMVKHGLSREKLASWDATLKKCPLEGR